MVLTHGDEERSFVRTIEGKWTYPDSGFEAMELREVLDWIVYLRAENYLAADEVEPFEDFVLVEVRGRDGPHSVRIGPTASGRIECEYLQNRSVLASPELFDKLVEIVALKKGD